MSDSDPVSTSSAPASVDVLNATPLDLAVYDGSTKLTDLPSHQTWSYSFEDGATSVPIELRPINGLCKVGALQLKSGDPQITIRPDNLRPSVQASGVSATFVNSSDVYVDLYWLDVQGAEQPATIGLEPGDHDEWSSFAYQIWAARATFTGDLLGIYVLSTDSQQTITVNGSYPKSLAANLPLPPPLPLPSGTPIALVGSTREAPTPESKDYIAIAAHGNLVHPQFNTRTNVVTRTVRISGVKLIWDQLEDPGGLMSYQGEGVLDLEHLELYADQIVVASPLRFPRTNVTIYARELEFKGDGQIDTTPIPFTTHASSPYQTDHSVPTDKDGKPTYTAADGMHGEPGGSISLYVHTLTLPPDGGDTIRFKARGSDGQQAEQGGWHPYKQGTLDQPADAKAKNALVVTKADVESVFPNTFVSAVRADYWDWPDGKGGKVDWPGQITYNGQYLFPDGGGNVVDLVLIAHDDSFPSYDTNFFFFPPGTRQHVQKYWRNRAPIDQYQGLGFDLPQKHRPGDGEDAYPGGQPGNGGAAGKISTSLPLERVTALCDNEPGAPGPVTPAVAGLQRGGPSPAYQVQIDIVIKGDGMPTWIQVNDVSAQDGQAAAEKSGQVGDESDPTSDPTISWLQPEIVDAVLACASDAYQNGHRDLTRLLLEPYYAELRVAELDRAKILADRADALAKLPPDAPASPEQAVKSPVPDALESQAATIWTMRANLLNNVDYYGNPPGWLPRLGLPTNVDLFQRTVVLATQLLYYALTAEKEYDDLEHADDLAKQTSDALGQELDECVKTLKNAYTDLAQARVDIQTAEQKLQDMQNNLDDLKALTEQESLQIEDRQRIFRGICKTVGGVLKLSPFGQPYVGMAGDVAANVGDIDFTDPKAIPTQIGSALGKIGADTDKFLQNNADLLVDDRVAGLREKLRLHKSEEADLTEQLTRAKTASANVEAKVEQLKKETSSRWTAERGNQKSQLQTMLNDVTKTSNDTSKTDEERQAATEARDRLTKQVGEAEAPSPELRRRQVSQDLANIDAAISGEEAQATADRGKANNARKTQLEAEKSQLEGFMTKIGDLQQQAREAQRNQANTKDELDTRQREWKQTFTRLQGIGTGISTLGQGIAALGTPLTTDDPDVKKLADHLLTSQQGARYRQYLKNLDELGKAQAAAMARLKQHQQEISSQAARISGNLSAQNALSQQRESFEGVLDLRTKRYLRGVQDRARESLRWSLYNFVMSYRYEFLNDVGNDFFNFDKIADELRKTASTTIDGKPTPDGAPRILTQQEFADKANKVLNDAMLAEAKTILQQREHRATAAHQNDVICQLSEPQREQLRLTGQVRFNLVLDMQKGNFDWVDARIADVNLDSVELETSKPDLSLRFTFCHSGESVLLGRDPQSDQLAYYFFRAAQNDDPITWGFGYNELEKDPTKRIQKDAEDNTVRDAFLNKMLQDASIQYHEYRPGYFGDLTLIASAAGTWDPSTISNITSLQFTVKYVLDS